MARDKCVLAYSGGMDSTISIAWIKEQHDMDVITLTVELGGGAESVGVRERALAAGALDAIVLDVRDEFIEQYVWRGLRAGAVYENQYALSTAFARPLMAQKLVEAAQKHGAVAVAHGCTGKGNDQVRFDVGVQTLSATWKTPLRVIAPARNWGMTRDEEKSYAAKAGIELREVGSDKRVYSIDRNVWGQAIEGEDLEDTWQKPPEDAYSWTVAPHTAPAQGEEVVVGFEAGTPVKLNCERLKPLALVEKLNDIAGKHGVGRIDHVENRLVGIKSREVYETPAASCLVVALQALEMLTLAREQQRLLRQLSVTYADLVYDGRWFTALRENLDACVDSIQQWTTGEVRLELRQGSVTVVGRRSPYSLYDFSLATYSTDDKFKHSSAEGFIDIYGLSARIQHRNQTMRDAK